MGLGDVGELPATEKFEKDELLKTLEEVEVDWGFGIACLQQDRESDRASCRRWDPCVPERKHRGKWNCEKGVLAGNMSVQKKI